MYFLITFLFFFSLANHHQAMETLLATSFAMGRTLVLPPHQKMYLLGKSDNNQRNDFSFDHFFHMESISQEHAGFDIITMEDFLKIFLDGQFKDPKTGNIKKVNFGHGGSSAKAKGEKTMKIRKSNPKARKNFRARHNCDNPGPKTKARYWSCKKW